MALPLMPKATAVWLVENTSLTFDQIADFCGLHMLEVQAIADGEVAQGIQGIDPVGNGQLSHEEIDRCQADPALRMQLQLSDVPLPIAKPRGTRYTPIAKRQDKPDGIAWLVKNHPELSDAQISKLLGTTKPTIAAVRDRSHWNTTNIRARNPVSLGLCGEAELQQAVERANRGNKNAAAPAAPAASEA